MNREPSPGYEPIDFSDPSSWHRLFEKNDDNAVDIPSLVQRLDVPKGKIDVVLDTDTFNEIDDQFALAYLVKSTEKTTIKAFYAAPFHNEKSSSPKDGMEKSFDEINKLLTLLKKEDLKPLVYKGSEDYLPDETTPVHSPAAEHLVELAMGYTPENPLYVVAIGAITNVASALLLQPEIRDRIVIVWLGGSAHDFPSNIEFNLTQDVAAARVIFSSGAAVIQLPCLGVVSAFRVSGPELREHLLGKNELCTYLAENTIAQAEADNPLRTWTRVIWDVTTIGWLLDEKFMQSCLVPSPIPEYTNRYSFDKTRHPIRYVYNINRDMLLDDLVKKLTDSV